MIDITSLKKHPRKFYSLFFIFPYDFDNLVSRVKPKWEQKEKQLKAKTNKKHKILTIGSGRLFKCTLEERITMYLMYKNINVSHSTLGELFEVDQSRISQYFKKIAKIVDTSYDYKEKIVKINLSKKQLLSIINK